VLAELAKTDKAARDAYAFLRVTGKMVSEAPGGVLAPYVDATAGLCGLQVDAVACGPQLLAANSEALLEALREVGRGARLGCAGLVCRVGESGPWVGMARRSTGPLRLAGYLPGSAGEATLAAWRAKLGP
jgi:hypothetical protein